MKMFNVEPINVHNLLNIVAIKIDEILNEAD